MSEQKQTASVIRFEKTVAEKNYEQSCVELLNILEQIDKNFGTIANIEIDFPEQLQLNTTAMERDIYFCTRMATAMTTLFQDPELRLSQAGSIRFLNFQRWIALIFASSPYINADHILYTYDQNPNNPDRNNITIKTTESDIIKFCIMYLPESNVHINLDALWNASPKHCASLCYALQTARFIGTEAAFSKRNAILQWFPEKLAQCELKDLPANVTHDVYMHCSYDIAANKHDVKRAVNQVIRRHLLSNDWQDRDVSSIGQKNGKPVMVVLLEHFHSSHSIYRTHSTSMIAAREHFHLIGIGNNAVDELGRQVFDEFFELSQDISVSEKLIEIHKICEENGAAIFYMPSIGMDLTTIFASNTRLAPIQAVALGHPGTTHSEFIEYVVVEDDYVGSEACFSEKLIRLPKDALPYVPSALAPEKVEYLLRENPEIVNIGIASTTMKLNPYFLSALREIRNRAKVPVHFHFALGQSSGITHPYVARFIKSYLGDSATAHPHSPYEKYLRILHKCDMMLNPFPFGNTNGIIDMVTLGLVGVCKTGPEVHEHIDEGLFKRLGLPEWLIANTVDEYVERAVRLAENHEERLALRRHIIENNGLQTLFTGNPKPMGEAFVAKLQEWMEQNGVSSKAAKTAKTVKKSPAKKAETKTPAKTVKKAEPKTAAKKKETPLKEAAKKIKKDKA